MECILLKEKGGILWKPMYVYYVTKIKLIIRNSWKYEIEREKLTMGMSLIARWGKGSVVQTWKGERGAPKTPRSSLRSEEEEQVASGPFFQWAHLPCSHLEELLSSSGPSFSGDSASTGLAGVEGHVPSTNNSGRGTWFSFLLRRRKLPLLAGDSPLTTSSFRDQNKPCFLSILVYHKVKLCLFFKLKQRASSHLHTHTQPQLQSKQRGERKDKYQ